MKINTNGRFTTQRMTGVQRYAVEIVYRLKNVKSIELLLLVPKNSKINYVERLGTEQKPFGYFKSHFWEQLQLPLYSSAALLNLCNTFPLFKSRQLVVIHDASIYDVPEGYTKLFVLFYKFIYSFLRYKKTVKIVTDSNYSKVRLAKCARINADRIKVIHCGVDHWNDVTPDPRVLDRFSLRSRRFLLAVASVNPNKNLSRLVTAYHLAELTDVPLVLVGDVNTKVFAKTTRIGSENVIQTGRVSDAELSALYGSATAFVFPSLYEGFGFPPLEAMTFGCPVISSREASLPEVCGEAALYCDARDVNSIASAIRAITNDTALREALIIRGRAQVARFKWSSTVDALLNELQTL